MLRTRVIPVLLLQGEGLVKTTRFKEPRYLGDPINIVKLFNDKEVDEICLLDIAATKEKRGPDFGLIRKIASQAFMPMAYGGGITSLEEIRKLLALGMEKIILNTAAVETPGLISQAAAAVGSQSVVVSIDAKKKLLGGYQVLTHDGSRKHDIDPVTLARQAEQAGAGEIIINAMDRDGMMEGYDLPLVRQVASAVNVPVIALGGAGKVEHFTPAVKEAHASAVAAGSMFVYQGPHRAVLVNFPSQRQLREAFGPSA